MNLKNWMDYFRPRLMWYSWDWGQTKADWPVPWPCVSVCWDYYWLLHRSASIRADWTGGGSTVGGQGCVGLGGGGGGLPWEARGEAGWGGGVYRGRPGVWRAGGRGEDLPWGWWYVPPGPDPAAHSPGGAVCDLWPPPVLVHRLSCHDLWPAESEVGLYPYAETVLRGNLEPAHLGLGGGGGSVLQVTGTQEEGGGDAGEGSRVRTWPPVTPDPPAPTDTTSVTPCNRLSPF